MSRQGDSPGTSGQPIPLHTLPVGAIVVRDGVVTEASPRGMTLLADDATPLVGQRLAALVAPRDRPLVDALLVSRDVRADRTTAPAPPPVTVALARSPARWVELSVSPLADGPHAGHLVVAHDVTAAVTMARVARELASATTIIDDNGSRLWGPIGRDLPLDGVTLPGNVADRIHPEDLAPVIALWTKVRELPGSRAVLEVRLRDHTLEGRWSQARVQVANHHDTPEIGGTLVSVDEFTGQDLVASIGRTSGSYLSIAEAAPVGIIVLGPAGYPLYFNEAARALLPGVGPGDAERDWIARADPEHRAPLRALVASALDAGEQASLLAAFPRDPSPAWLLVTVAPREGEDATVLGFVVTLQDVTAEVEARTALESAQARLVYYATHDPLTGLANRTVLADSFLDATHDEQVGALFCDLDGFKEVNDRFGHDVGDAVLVEVAHRLRRATRSTDVVARLGGDEFLVLVPACDADSLAALRERVLETVGAPLTIDGRPVPVGVSVGAATAGATDSIDDLVRKADDAMYRHKRAR